MWSIQVPNEALVPSPASGLAWQPTTAQTQQDIVANSNLRGSGAPAYRALALTIPVSPRFASGGTPTKMRCQLALLLNSIPVWSGTQELEPWAAALWLGTFQFSANLSEPIQFGASDSLTLFVAAAIDQSYTASGIVVGQSSASLPGYVLVDNVPGSVPAMGVGMPVPRVFGA